MGENDISGGILYAAPIDGSSGWVKIGDVTAFDLSKTDVDSDTVLNDNNEYLKLNQPTEMTFTIKIKTKHRRKTFKKWLMSKNYSRDEAEAICDMLALAQGKVSYEQWFWIFSLSHNELRNLIYNWGRKIL